MRTNRFHFANCENFKVEEMEKKGDLANLLLKATDNKLPLALVGVIKLFQIVQPNKLF